MAGLKAKGGKKNRKYGRMKKFCERYKLEGRKKKNLIQRLKTRIRRNEAKAKKHARKGLKAIKPDIGAIQRLKELVGS